MYEPEIERANGLPITVTCTNSTSNTEASRKAALIEFDYELAIVNPNEHLAEFMKQDLPSLEFFLLFYVADEAGLLECNLERQVIAPTQTGAAGDVSAISGIDLERLNVDIVSLSSTSTDTRDLTVGTL